MNESRCVLCEAYFRQSAMVGEKCVICNAAYPNAKTKEEIKIKFKNKARTMSEETVKEIVYDILEEANLKRKKCENCGKLYFRTSPAQKICKECKLKEVK